MEKRLAFHSGRAVALYRGALFILAFVALGFLVALAPSVPLLPIVLVIALLVAAAIVFVLSPFLTDHWLTRSRLILRQGWYFRIIVPFADIESIRPSEDTARSRAPLGIHRPLGQSTLYVMGGRTGIVVLRLRTPRRFWQSFGLQADEIVFDVSDREAFLRAADERRTLLAPVQSDRADADLRY
jgi:hypothetical protein